MRLRGKKKFSDEVSEFVSSLEVDANFIDAEILVGLAHVKALKEVGLIDSEEEVSLQKALKEAHERMTGGEFEFEASLEDIHPNIEKYVLEKCGITGGKLNTARSREDMVTTDIRMACRIRLLDVQEKVLQLLDVMTKKSWKYADVVMPIYSREQHAQVGTFGHFLMSYADAFIRDAQRLDTTYSTVNKCPLGSFEGGGSSFALDRMMLSEMLGFDDVLENSLDAVANRDFLLEINSALAILMMNVSRLAADLVRFSTFEYGIVRISDAYTSSTPSTPHRRTADILELIRGRAAETFSSMAKVFMIVKGLSSGYNRDLQEAHSTLFRNLNTVEDSLEMLKKIIDTLTLNDAKALGICDKDFVCASDLVEMLIRKGIPYRNASAVVGTLINECLRGKKRFSEVEPELLESIILRQLKFEIKISDGDLKNAIIPEQVIVGRKTKGAPNPKEVKRMIANRENTISLIRKDMSKRRKTLDKVSAALK
ncbi:MAG: argininosuccinate lyase [archaeon]